MTDNQATEVVDKKNEAKQIDPQEVQGEVAQDAVANEIFKLRESILEETIKVESFQDLLFRTPSKYGEIKAKMESDAKLVVNHLEYARFRLGSIMKAKNGGVSILSK